MRGVRWTMLLELLLVSLWPAFGAVGRRRRPLGASA
jgi:hypothetical protein